MNKAHTLYMSPAMADLEPGMYLCLFHGRDTAEENVDGWGYNGPCIGPLTGYHVTYNCTTRFRFVHDEDRERFFPGSDPHDWIFLPIVEDMFEFDGKFYGDWTLCPVPEPEINE